jgi:erythromycin esterase-like protein
MTNQIHNIFILKIRMLMQVMSFIFIVSSHHSSAQVLNELVPLSHQKQYSQYVFLDSALTGVEILALGESTHGTHEFFASKTQMIQYAVTNHHYKAIGIEADFAGTLVTNHYVLNKNGTLKEAGYMMGISAWMTQEMDSLIEWLADYNSNLPVAEKVHIFGFDYRGTLGLIEYISGIAKQISFPDTASFDTLKKWRLASDINLMYYDSLAGRFSKYLRNTNPDLQQHMRFCLDALRKVLADKQGSKNLIMYSNNRDKWMYENVLYHKQKFNRMILWAHNEHIARKSGAKGLTIMGQYLSDTFVNRYYAIALSTYGGHVGFYNAYTKLPDSLPIPDKYVKGIENLLAIQSQTDFFIFTKQLRNYKLPDKYRGNFAISLRQTSAKQYFLTKDLCIGKPEDRFDAMIFHRNTTASRH